MIFLKALLLFVIAIAVVIGVIAYRIANGINNVRQQFRNMGQQQRARRNYERTGNYGDREVIIDRRTPDEAHRKIIPDDEGEYVEFEES